MHFLNPVKSNSHYEWHYVHSIINEFPLGTTRSAKYRRLKKHTWGAGPGLGVKMAASRTAHTDEYPQYLHHQCPSPRSEPKLPPTSHLPRRPSKTINSSFNNRRISGEMWHLWGIWIKWWKKQWLFKGLSHTSYQNLLQIYINLIPVRFQKWVL